MPPSEAVTICNKSATPRGRLPGEPAVNRLLIVLALLCALPVLAAPQQDRGSPADILAVRNIEIIFHTAGSVLPAKDLELMMSLFADDAVLTDTAHDNKVYQGKAQVRTYWADVSGPFRPEHHWIGYTPAMRIKSQVDGDHATLYFECLWMDVDTGAVGAHAFTDMVLARDHGGWLVKTIRVGKVEKL
jgi:ketosteroid isomerase-like protein